MSLMAMSISGAVLILVILAVRAGLKGRLPKRTFAVLWMVALIRLLIPFSVPSSWSAYTLLQNAVPETEQVRYFTDMIAGNPSGGAARFGSASWLYGTDTAGGAGRMDSGREPECSPDREAERRWILPGNRSQDPVQEAEHGRTLLRIRSQSPGSNHSRIPHLAYSQEGSRLPP